MTDRAVEHIDWSLRRSSVRQQQHRERGDSRSEQIEKKVTDRLLDERLAVMGGVRP